MGEILFYYVLFLAVILAVNWFTAREFYKIAVMKGHPQKKYFWWCFLVGFVGWPMIIALPDRGTAQQKAVIDTDELPEL